MLCSSLSGVTADAWGAPRLTEGLPSEPRRPEARGSPFQVLKGQDRQSQSPHLVRLSCSTGKGELGTPVPQPWGERLKEVLQI